MNVAEPYNQFKKWKRLLQATLTAFHRVWCIQLGVQMRTYDTVKLSNVHKFARATECFQ